MSVCRLFSTSLTLSAKKPLLLLLLIVTLIIIIIKYIYTSRIGMKASVGLLYLGSILGLSHGLMFHLEPNSRKCLKEEIHKGVLVTGEYDISTQPEQSVDLMVIDTKGQHFVNRENTDKGKFAFTADDYDVFEICFMSRYIQYLHFSPLMYG